MYTQKGVRSNLRAPRRTSAWTRSSFSSYNDRAQGENVHYAAMHYSPHELWWWINGQKYYRLANQTGKTRTFQRGALDHDCITMFCFKVVLQLVFFFFKLGWASGTIWSSKPIFWEKKRPIWRGRGHNGWNNYARILKLFWLLKWLLNMLNCYRGVKNPDLPMSKIFIHIIVTLIQVLDKDKLLLHHQKTSKSVAALSVWFVDQVHLLWKKKSK